MVASGTQRYVTVNTGQYCNDMTKAVAITDRATSRPGLSRAAFRWPTNQRVAAVDRGDGERDRVGAAVPQTGGGVAHIESETASLTFNDPEHPVWCWSV